MLPFRTFAQTADFVDFDCSTIIPSTNQVLTTESADDETLFDDPTNELTIEGTVRKALRWRKKDSQDTASNKIVIGVGFLDNPSSSWKRRVIERASVWTTANNGELGRIIEFDFETPRQKYNIRVRRSGITTPARNNSRVGRSALNVTNQNQETMNIYNLESVTHEFGHALGLVHEHTNPGVTVTLLRNKTIRYYYDKYGWDANTTKVNLFNAGERCLRDPTFNENSVMGYKIPAEITKEGIDLLPGKDITQRDLTCAVSLYAG